LGANQAYKSTQRESLWSLGCGVVVSTLLFVARSSPAESILEVGCAGWESLAELRATSQEFCSVDSSMEMPLQPEVRPLKRAYSGLQAHSSSSRTLVS
jgi:hypothetical protein